MEKKERKREGATRPHGKQNKLWGEKKKKKEERLV